MTTESRGLPGRSRGELSRDGGALTVQGENAERRAEGQEGDQQDLPRTQCTWKQAALRCQVRVWERSGEGLASDSGHPLLTTEKFLLKNQERDASLQEGRN